MEYALGFDEGPAAVPAGSGILLMHPSTMDADTFETAFLTAADDPALLISTHSAAREVQQKIEHYGLDPGRVEILDTISVDRGYTRRQADGVTYLSSPDDLDGLLTATEEFLERRGPPARVSVDSVTELRYYADDERVTSALASMLEILEEYEAVGLFQLAADGEDAVAALRDRFAGVLEVDEDGGVTATF
ncbi:MAG: ATPase domain-containing protein [Salinirussus sp.]